MCSPPWSFCLMKPSCVCGRTCGVSCPFSVFAAPVLTLPRLSSSCHRRFGSTPKQVEYRYDTCDFFLRRFGASDDAQMPCPLPLWVVREERVRLFATVSRKKYAHVGMIIMGNSRSCPISSLLTIRCPRILTSLFGTRSSSWTRSYSPQGRLGLPLPLR